MQLQGARLLPLPVLECVKPGVGSGQVLLAVDLTIAGQPEAVLATIDRLGYRPTLRHVSYSSGVHVLAVLKEEQHPTPVDENYWLEELKHFTIQSAAVRFPH